MAVDCLGEGVPQYWQAQSGLLNKILEFLLSTFFSVDVVVENIASVLRP